MGLSARLPLAADRYGACVRTVIIRGLDLTGVTMRAQVRLRPDTPGAPLIDLNTVTAVNAEGLYLVSAAADDDGVMVSTVQIRINETTLEGLPYSGEVGEASTFAWDWQATIGGDKRRLAYGDFVVLPGVTGADSAPTDRPVSYSVSSSSASTWSVAELTFGPETVTIVIDGADFSSKYAAAAERAAVDAAASAAEVVDRVVLDGDAVPGFIWPWLDASLRLVGGITGGMALEMPAVSASADTSADPADGEPAAVTVLKDDLGRALMGALVRDDGKIALEMRFGPLAVADMAEQLSAGGTVDTSVLRGDWGSNVANVRAKDSLYIASCSDRLGRQFDCGQLKMGAQDTLVMQAGKSAAPMQFRPFFGQSNDGLGGSTGRIINEALFPFSVYGFAGVNGSSYQGSVELSAATLTDLVPAIDYTLAATPGINFGYGMAARNAWDGADDPGYIIATPWEGSQPIESFFPFATSGHYNFENLITFATRAKALAAGYGRTVQCDYLVFIQGETASAGATPDDPANATVYANLLGNAAGNLIDTVTPALKTALGQSSGIIWLIVQTGTSKASSGEYYDCIGQWQVAEARADAVLVGPMYQFKLGEEPAAPSNIHTSPEGRAMLGETLADVEAYHKANGDWKPIQPVSAVLTGSTIVVTFEGSMLELGYSLAEDTDWIPATESMGFTFADDSGSAPTISGVAITGQKEVTVTLASAPTGGSQELRYAIDEFDDVTYWPTRRGTLMAETDRPSFLRRFFRSAGIAMPERVRHYAIRFIIAVS